MAYKKTLADNHLSEGARKRAMITGDTETYTTKHIKPGSTWDVNPQEKKLMSMRGAEGEKLVDAIGSGTINPYTGNEEKFIDPASISAYFTIGSAVLGGIQAITGGKARTQQASAQAKLSQLEIDEATEAQEALGPAKGAKEQVAREEYKFGLEGLSSQTGIAKEDLNKQMNTAIQKSGLATSGTIEGKQSQMWKRIQGAFSRGQEGLMGQLGKAMGGIEEWFEGEKSRLGGIIKRATLQKKAFEKQSEGWYLGKNIGL
tara:strand:+ start:304 stop:1080 length:777 start_codon:yes stop_codon:yes gene_type:complete